MYIRKAISKSTMLHSTNRNAFFISPIHSTLVQMQRNAAYTADDKNSHLSRVFRRAPTQRCHWTTVLATRTVREFLLICWLQNLKHNRKICNMNAHWYFEITHRNLNSLWLHIQLMNWLMSNYYYGVNITKNLMYVNSTKEKKLSLYSTGQNLFPMTVPSWSAWEKKEKEFSQWLPRIKSLDTIWIR